MRGFKENLFGFVNGSGNNFLLIVLLYNSMEYSGIFCVLNQQENIYLFSHIQCVFFQINKFIFQFLPFKANFPSLHFFCFNIISFHISCHSIKSHTVKGKYKHQSIFKIYEFFLLFLLQYGFSNYIMTTFFSCMYTYMMMTSKVKFSLYKKNIKNTIGLVTSEYLEKI